jgi:hypothetical protein
MAFGRLPEGWRLGGIVVVDADRLSRGYSDPIRQSGRI